MGKLIFVKQKHANPRKWTLVKGFKAGLNYQ